MIGTAGKEELELFSGRALAEAFAVSEAADGSSMGFPSDVSAGSAAPRYRRNIPPAHIIKMAAAATHAKAVLRLGKPKNSRTQERSLANSSRQWSGVKVPAGLLEFAAAKVRREFGVSTPDVAAATRSTPLSRRGTVMACLSADLALFQTAGGAAMSSLVRTVFVSCEKLLFQKSSENLSVGVGWVLGVNFSVPCAS